MSPWEVRSITGAEAALEAGEVAGEPLAVLVEMVGDGGRGVRQTAYALIIVDWLKQPSLHSTIVITFFAIFLEITFTIYIFLCAYMYQSTIVCL